MSSTVPHRIGQEYRLAGDIQRQQGQQAWGKLLRKTLCELQAVIFAVYYLHVARVRQVSCLVI